MAEACLNQLSLTLAWQQFECHAPDALNKIYNFNVFWVIVFEQVVTRRIVVWLQQPLNLVRLSQAV